MKPGNKLYVTRMFAFFAALILTRSVMAEMEIDVDQNGVALQGHDPVAYFVESKPVPGSAEFSVSHGDATFYFSNAANRDLFTNDPEIYLPQYGGYCAFGTTFQKKVPGDPLAWEIVDDKLYINSSPDIGSRWSENASGYIDKADSIWVEIKDKHPATL